MIIAIDGPAGSGKSTTARAVARRLGYMYLDTGAMYRAVALAFVRESAEISNSEAPRLLAGIRVDVTIGPQGQHVLLNGEDVSQAIRSPDVTSASSRVAALPPVREKLVAEQRRIARSYERERGGVVIDGRDIGTVVFPDADVKIFMVADEQVRARRRFEELRADGVETTFESVLADVRARDEKDTLRESAPLKKAPDAIELDTSRMDIEDQVNAVIKVVKERQNLSTV